MTDKRDTWSKTLSNLFGTKATRFQYSPLIGNADIRVLDLLPGVKDSQVQCRLRHISLDDPNESYTALSYVWGSVSQLEYITCNNQPRPVTPNLYSALRRVRWLKEKRTLWVDAICINQGNLEERSSQVALMSRIYRGAVQTIADLGEWDEDDRDLAALDKSLPQALEMMSKSDQPHILAPDVLARHSLPVAEDPVWLKVAGIYTRPWFRRVWVIQEYVLSSEVDFLLGTLLIPSKLFFKTASVLLDMGILGLGLQLMSWAGREEAKRSYSAWGSMVAAREDLMLQKPRSLLRLLIDSRSCQASDPRDKIFGLFSLATDLDHLGLSVDYRQSSHQLFHQTARVLLEKDNSIEVLLEAGGEWSDLSHYFKVPNWVPNWSRYQRRGPYLSPELTDSEHGSLTHGAAGQSKAKIQFLSNNKLAVQGAVLDSVIAAGSDFQPDIEDLALTDNAIYHALFDYEYEANTLIRNLTTYPTGEPILEAYCRTLTLNSIGPNCTSSNIRTLTDAYAAFLSLGELYNPSGNSIKDIFSHFIAAIVSPNRGTQFNAAERAAAEVAGKVAYLFINKLMLAVQGARFFVTERGYMGMGVGASKGDVVALINGSPVLFLLHPDRFREPNMYLLKGPCNVYGLMNGEASKMAHDREEMIVLE